MSEQSDTPLCKKRRLSSAVDAYSEVKWDNCAKSLMCPLCRAAFTQPLILSPCGHTFCAKCIDVFVSQPFSQKKCPMCRVAIEKCLPNFVVDGICSHLDVRCDNTGCDWSGEAHQRASHELVCDHVHVECKACGSWVKRRDMPTHSTGDVHSRTCLCANILGKPMDGDGTKVLWWQWFGTLCGPMTEDQQRKSALAEIPSQLVCALQKHRLQPATEAAWKLSRDWHSPPESVAQHMPIWMSQGAPTDTDTDCAHYRPQIRSFMDSRMIDCVEECRQVLGLEPWTPSCRSVLWKSAEFLFRKGCLLMVEPSGANASGDIDSAVPRIVTQEINHTTDDQRVHTSAVMPMLPSYKSLFYRELVEERPIIRPPSVVVAPIMPLWAVLAALGGADELQTHMADMKGVIVTYLRGEEPAEAFLLYACPHSGFVILGENVVTPVLLITHASNPLIQYIPRFMLTDDCDIKDLFFALGTPRQRLRTIGTFARFFRLEDFAQPVTAMVLPSGCVCVHMK